MNCRNCGRRPVSDGSNFCSDACDQLALHEVKRIEARLGGLELDRHRRATALAGQRAELAALKRELRRSKRRLLQLLAEPVDER